MLLKRKEDFIVDKSWGRTFEEKVSTSARKTLTLLSDVCAFYDRAPDKHPKKFNILQRDAIIV